jgi:hypothetical protein
MLKSANLFPVFYKKKTPEDDFLRGSKHVGQDSFK